MFLDLTIVRQPETPVDRTFAPEAFAPDDAFRLIAPAHVVATLHKDDERFRLVGRATTTVELICSRCAEPYAMPVDGRLDLRFLPQALAGKKDVDPDDDPTTTFYSDDRIDLGQVVREQCLLAIPMKPLCAADCQGLCPQCGINLNTERCQCAPAWQDPRLAVLQSLASRTNHDA
jgi:uncharacterized protein